MRLEIGDQIELHSNNVMVTIMVITWTTTNIIIEIIILFIKRHGDCGVPSRAAAIHHRSTAIISSLAHSNTICPVKKYFPTIHTNTFYPLEKYSHKYILPFGKVFSNYSQKYIYPLDKGLQTIHTNTLYHIE